MKERMKPGIERYRNALEIQKEIMLVGSHLAVLGSLLLITIILF